MMRPVVVAAALACLATVAHAQGRRPDTRTMSCEQVQSLIGARGAVVMSTGQHTYDRYVTDRFQCMLSGEVAVRAYVPATDAARCPVWRCEIIDPVDRGGEITN
jgi:hypothetical protein